jgi:ABC-type glycerol-3-phosphate transport system permease component
MMGTTPYRTRLAAARLGAYALMTVLALACIVPLYLMLVNATRTNNEILSGVSFLPGTAAGDNFSSLVFGKTDPVTGMHKEGLNILAGFLNSFLIAASSTALTGYFGALTAWAFALYRFRGKAILWGIIPGVIMLPPTVSLIGFYKMVAGLGLIDTYWPLILPAIASPFAVFFLRQYLSRAVPASLVEAARMDGARELGIFHRIGLPMALPGLATISILGFLGSWNSYLAPLIVLNDKNSYTLPLLIQQLNTSLYNRDFGAMNMGIALSILPVLAMFSVFSKALIDGVSAGSLKE